jgi:hypothetical protein
MHVTFTIKGMTDLFFDGADHLPTPGLLQQTDEEKFWCLNALARDNTNVSMRVGASNQVRDIVDLNQILRGNHRMTFSLAPRKGYKLATFELVACS